MVESAVRPRPLFGMASAVFALLTLIAPLLVFLYHVRIAEQTAPEPGQPNLIALIWLMYGLHIGGKVALGFAVAGVIAGLLGLLSIERLRLLSVIGIIWNGAITVFLLRCVYHLL
jgi:hypothetical protein